MINLLSKLIKTLYDILTIPFALFLIIIFVVLLTIYHAYIETINQSNAMYQLYKRIFIKIWRNQNY